MSHEHLKPFPEPYEEVRRLFYEFVAKAERLVNVTQGRVSLDFLNNKMDMQVRVEAHPSDHLTAIIVNNNQPL